MLTRRILLGGALAAPALVPAWSAAPPASYLDELRALMRVGNTPGAVIGAVSDGKPAWTAPLGVQTAGASEAVTASTLFQAASLSKQITAYAAFQLRDEGKLDFDRPLAAYVDDLRHPLARTVTPRHVLSHSSGFPNWRSTHGANEVPELVPEFAPGSKYRYSGEGYFYLQRVLEAVSDRGFGELIRDRVFRPLGMDSSTLVWDPETMPRTAQPHNGRGDLRQNWDRAARGLRHYADRVNKTVEQLRYADYSAAIADSGPVLPNRMQPNAASSLVTCAVDYAKFLAAAMKRPEYGQRQVTINEYLGWGLGWALESYAGHQYWWQWGDNPGYKNIVLVEPANRSAIFVFTNGDAGTRIYDRAVTHATGHDHPVFFWL